MALVVVALAGSLLCPGCGPEIRDPATGAGADYDWGILEATLDRPIAEVYAAARQAVRDLDLCVFREARDGISAEILAINAWRDRVDLTLGARPGPQTELNIEIGLTGDRDKSIMLFQSIVARLPGQEPEPVASRAGRDPRPADP
jgi:hypothetical protein